MCHQKHPVECNELKKKKNKFFTGSQLHKSDFYVSFEQQTNDFKI